jgi:hypothetical protein
MQDLSPLRSHALMVYIRDGIKAENGGSGVNSSRDEQVHPG